MLKKTIADILSQVKNEKNLIFIQIDDWVHMLVIPPSFEYTVEETKQVAKEIQKIILSDRADDTRYQSILWRQIAQNNYHITAPDTVWSSLTRSSDFPKAQLAFFIDTSAIESKYQSLVHKMGYSSELLKSQNILQVSNGYFEKHIDLLAFASQCIWTCTNAQSGIVQSVRAIPSQFRLFQTLYRELGPAFPKASFWRADQKLFVMHDKLYGHISYESIAKSLTGISQSPKNWLSGLDLRDLLAINEQPSISVRSPTFQKARPQTLCQDQDGFLLVVEIENSGRLRTVAKLGDAQNDTRFKHYIREARTHLSKRHYSAHAWLTMEDDHFAIILVGDKIANICVFPELIRGTLDACEYAATDLRVISTSENSVILTDTNATPDQIENLRIKSNILLQTLFPQGCDALELDQYYHLTEKACGTFDITSVPAPFFDLIDTANDPKIALPPGRTEYLKGLAYELIRDWKLAVQAFKKAYTFDTSDGDISFALGRAMSELHDHQNALPFLKRAFDALPEDPDIANSLGMAYLECQDRSLATKIMEKAVALEPDDAQFLANLGRCYFSIQKWDEAESVLTKALECAPNFFEAHATLAQLRWRLGDMNNARKHARKAFAANPSNRMVQDLLWALTIDNDDGP